MHNVTGAGVAKHDWFRRQLAGNCQTFLRRVYRSCQLARMECCQNLEPPNATTRASGAVFLEWELSVCGGE